MFDQDNSGTITFDELASVMRILGNNPTSEDLDNMMAELDKDGGQNYIVITIVNSIYYCAVGYAEI